MSGIQFATFDCYGTLIDWEGGAASFLYEIARRHEPDPPPGRELRARWEVLQFERLGAPYRAYREVLADSLSEWAGERGYRWNDRDGEALARAMESWQPFPDTVPALRAAKEAGLRLWIISNTDRAIIEHSLRHLEVEFDGVTVAADQGTVGEVAQIIRNEVRDTDVLGLTTHGLLSLVLLDADYENSTRVIDRVMERMDQYNFPTPLRLSVGAACYPTDAVDARSLQHQAISHPVVNWRRHS